MYFRVVKWNRLLRQWDGTCWGSSSRHPQYGVEVRDDDAEPADFSWVKLTQERAKDGLQQARLQFSKQVYRLERYDDGEPDPLCGG